jgi:hypothetical protein
MNKRQNFSLMKNTQGQGILWGINTLYPFDPVSIHDLNGLSGKIPFRTVNFHSLRKNDRDYTQPVGLGKPAILQAPLPGPEGNNSYIYFSLYPVTLDKIRTMGAIPFFL